MKLSRAMTTTFAALAATGILFAAAAQDKKPEAGKQDKPAKEEKPGKKDPSFLCADQAEFKEAAPGVSMATITGDPDKGAHRTFVKFAPGATVPLHTHTSDLRIVVVKGAYVYKPEKGDEQRVGPGCYLSIPGSERHASGSDAKEGALFYEEGSGKFDLLPVEREKK